MDNAWSEDGRRKPNTLAVWGNATTMNLNTLILTNITNSPYYKGALAELKTYHEVVDEIYYKVKHLEPWERGSRRTSGQTGMCGGVRGVGAGGIISTAFCLLYKLFAMRLTRKQVVGLMNHGDSPYIRGLGFMYVRFTQAPADLWEWFEPYMDDTEEVDVRAGGGQIITIGEMVRLFLTKLDWFSSLFPRIPVPIQIAIDKKLTALKLLTSIDATPRNPDSDVPAAAVPNQPLSVKLRSDPSDSYHDGDSRDRSSATRVSASTSTRKPSRSRSRSRERNQRRERDRSRDRDRHRQHRDGRDRRSSRDRHKHRRSRSRSPRRSQSDTGSSARHHRDRDRDRR